MKHFVTLAVLLTSLVALAQTDCPNAHDSNGDGAVTEAGMIPYTPFIFAMGYPVVSSVAYTQHDEALCYSVCAADLSVGVRALPATTKQHAITVSKCFIWSVYSITD
jgi:hypothetical protein